MGQENTKEMEEFTDIDFSNVDPSIMQNILVDAVNNRYIPVLEFLLKHYKFDLKTSANAELLWQTSTFTKYGNTNDTVAILVRAGIDVNFRNKKGSTYLHTIAENVERTTADLSLASLMLDYGADANALNEKGLSVLHTAILMRFYYGAPLDLIKELLNKNASIDDILDDRTNYLRFTVPYYGTDTMSKQEVIDNCLKRFHQSDCEDCQSGQEDVNKFSYLMVAFVLADYDLAKLLMEYGARLTEDAVESQYPQLLNSTFCESSYQELYINTAKDDDGIKKEFRVSDGLQPIYIRYIMKHFALQKFRNIDINENSIEVLNLYLKFPKMEEFFQECIKQLTRMNEMMVVSDIPYSVFLTKNLKELSVIIKTNEFVEKYKESLQAISFSFPLYFMEVDKAFKTAIKRNNIILNAQEKLQALDKTLSQTSLEKIAYLQCYGDLLEHEYTSFFNLGNRKEKAEEGFGKYQILYSYEDPKMNLNSNLNSNLTDAWIG